MLQITSYVRLQSKTKYDSESDVEAKFTVKVVEVLLSLARMVATAHSQSQPIAVTLVSGASFVVLSSRQATSLLSKRK